MHETSSAAPVRTAAASQADAPVGLADPERLDALRRYASIDASKTFDRVTRLAASAFGVASSYITFLSGEQAAVRARHGLEEALLSSEAPLRTQVVARGVPVAIEDLSVHPQFAELPLVAESPYVRFYAGVPLRTPAGHVVGALSLLGTAPRAFTSGEMEQLEDFASLAMEGLELRRQQHDEANLRQQVEQDHQLLHSVVNALPGAFYLFSRDSSIKLWNSRLEEFLGFSREEMAASRPLDLIAPDDRARVAKAIEQGFVEGEGHVEGCVLTRSGAAVPHAFHTRRIYIDGEAHLAGLGIDISRAKASERALRASEERFRSVVERARDIIFQTDGRGHWTLLSPSWEAVTGYSVEESLGQPAIAFAHPDDRTQAFPGYRKMAAMNGDMYEDRKRLVTKSGETRWMHLRGRIIRDEDGNIQQTTGTLSDVTDTMRFRAERDARRQAEELLEAKTSFLNNMSHELRTPLSSILGFADVLAEEDSAPRREFARHIITSAERLRQTLDSVLRLAQLDGGGIDLELERIDLGQTIAEEAPLLREEARREGLAFNVDLQGGACALLDAGALHRVLTNLVSNALKFTEKGSLTVRVERTAQKACLHVCDTGIGIGEDFRGRLFDEFAQESVGLKRTHRGSGLGLAVTKRLVTLMNGTIDVESTQGEGTCFTVAFPLVDEAPCLASDPPFLLSRGAKPLKVLLVEGATPLSYEEIEAYCHLTVVRSFEEARARGTTAAAPGLIIVDTDPAKGDSLDTDWLRRHVRALREMPAYRGIPVLAATGATSEPRREQLLSAGFDACLPRPFTQKDMLSRIARLAKIVT